jgi:hypothetical protein
VRRDENAHFEGFYKMRTLALLGCPGKRPHIGEGCRRLVQQDFGVRREYPSNGGRQPQWEASRLVDRAPTRPKRVDALVRTLEGTAR